MMEVRRLAWAGTTAALGRHVGIGVERDVGDREALASSGA